MNNKDKAQLTASAKNISASEDMLCISK